MIELSRKTHTAIMSPITFGKLKEHGMIIDGKYEGYEIELNDTAPEDLGYIMSNEYLKMWKEIKPKKEDGVKIVQIARPNIVE